MFAIFFFFFSSRRRHTRYWRDWSSDVCSSDLTFAQNNAEQRFKEIVDLLNTDLAGRSLFAGRAVDRLPMESYDRIMNGDGARRSEERRVGKECRSRGSPYH